MVEAEKDPNIFNDVYKELIEIVGYDNTLKIHKYFRGQQLTFPIKLYKTECIKVIIKKEYNGKNAKALSRTYGYSERWIKEMARK